MKAINCRIYVSFVTYKRMLLQNMNDAYWTIMHSIESPLSNILTRLFPIVFLKVSGVS